jgi:hypothetical protein
MVRDPQQPLAQVVGAVLTLVGVAGFFTGGTLLIFGINALHNVVHLVSGVLGLAAGFYAGGQWARYYNQGLVSSTCSSPPSDLWHPPKQQACWRSILPTTCCI